MKRHLNLKAIKVGFKWEREISIYKPNTWSLHYIFNMDDTNNYQVGLFIDKISVKQINIKSTTKDFCLNNSNQDVKPRKWIQFDVIC